MSAKVTATGGAGFWGRLYRGDTEIPIVQLRRVWYIMAAVILFASLGLIFGKGFNLGIEFEGGTKFEVPAAEGVSLPEAEDAVSGAGANVSSGQTVGSGDAERYVIRAERLSSDDAEDARAALAETLNQEVSVSEVSSSWGGAVTRQALIAMGVFALLVAAFLWLRFEPMMAASALLALVHDLVITAGVFALVGFEVTPSTVVGMMTIMSYSLYDTVVVFDKVQENTKGILLSKRRTYEQAANRAVNQMLMRCINTSLTGLLPVGGLLFVGVGLLGVGTLKDLALVLFVGIVVGTFSSLFIATPALVDLKRRDGRVRSHTAKVQSKQTAEGRDGFLAVSYDSAEDSALDDEADSKAAEAEADDESDAADSEEEFQPAAAPKPGARTTSSRAARKKKRR
ncbi:MAG: protein translocase subunit SecF [Stackebrandtia sp.]